MCLICIEFQKEKLTILEARRNYTEVALDIDVKHRQEIEDMLDLAEEQELMDAEYFDFISIDATD